MSDDDFVDCGFCGEKLEGKQRAEMEGFEDELVSEVVHVVYPARINYSDTNGDGDFSLFSVAGDTKLFCGRCWDLKASKISVDKRQKMLSEINGVLNTNYELKEDLKKSKSVDEVVDILSRNFDNVLNRLKLILQKGENDEVSG